MPVETKQISFINRKFYLDEETQDDITSFVLEQSALQYESDLTKMRTENFVEVYEGCDPVFLSQYYRWLNNGTPSKIIDGVLERLNLNA